MKESNSFAETLRSILRWRKLLLLVTLSALILSIIISFLLPVYYKSTEIFYPYSLESLDPKNIIKETETNIYGTSDDVDRLLQIGQSAQLAGFMVWKYNLYQRYNIDTSDKLASYKVSEEFKDNYKIIKNDKGAIEVNMLDKDPKVAAKMAKDITHFIDSVNLKPILESSKQYISILQSTIQAKQEELMKVDSLVDNKSNFGTKIITPNTLIESQKAGDMNKIITEKLMNVINLNQQYEQMDKLMNSNTKSISIIEEATPAVKKEKPVRWLIVVASTVITFFLCSLLILFLEFYNNNIKELLKDE